MPKTLGLLLSLEMPLAPAAALALGWLTSGELTVVNLFGLSTVEIELSGAFPAAAA